MEATSTKFGSTEVIHKAVRTKEEIQKKYAELCGTAGDRQYQIQKFKAQLDIINEELFSLDKEYLSLAKQEVNGTTEASPSVEETKTP